MKSIEKQDQKIEADHMSVTERFVRGLERTVIKLPSILESWNQIDESLCDEYIEQLDWVLTNQKSYLELSLAMPQYAEYSERCRVANKEISAYHDQILEKMGLEVVLLITVSAIERFRYMSSFDLKCDYCDTICDGSTGRNHCSHCGINLRISHDADDRVYV